MADKTREKKNIYQTINGKYYDVFFGVTLKEELRAMLSADNVFIVTDKNVDRLYLSDVEERKFILTPGERAKRIGSVEDICEAMEQAGCGRDALVLAVGGGVTGDIGGLAAALYMRGTRLIHVPTSLLAMVDSSIGGKTCVNSAGVKNMLGTFYMPEAVYSSLHFLQTLPTREIVCGMGELFKTALLDAAILEEFELFMRDVGNKPFSTAIFTELRFLNLMGMCIRYKLSLTDDDPADRGERVRLNIGHTLGHAFEVQGKFKHSHGEYVLHGLEWEAEIARDAALIKPEHYEKIAEYVRILTRGKELSFDADAVAALCTHDKKNVDNIRIVTSRAPGEILELPFRESELASALRRIQKKKSGK